jgi:hypothetical protein
VDGLLLIITLHTGGYCRDTKPDISYRIDPLNGGVSRCGKRDDGGKYME